MINLDKKILTLRGEEVGKSFPTQEEVESLPKKENGEPDISKLGKETYGNIILNSLASYIIRDKKEGFYINTLAQIVINGGEVELKEKFKKFLIRVLDDATIRMEKTKNGEEKKGIYVAWAIAQIEKDLGVKV